MRARRIETPVSGLDWFPTFLGIAGINDYVGTLDGNSLEDLFDGESKELDARPLFWHLASRWKHGTCSVIRKQPYKLIQFLKDGKLELYDLSSDPKEQHNLAEKKPDVAGRLLGELIQWRKANNVPLPPESALAF